MHLQYSNIIENIVVTLLWFANLGFVPVVLVIQTLLRYNLYAFVACFISHRPFYSFVFMHLLSGVFIVLNVLLRVGPRFDKNPSSGECPIYLFFTRHTTYIQLNSMQFKSNSYSDKYKQYLRLCVGKA